MELELYMLDIYDDYKIAEITGIKVKTITDWRLYYSLTAPEQVREITKKEDEMTPKRPIELVNASRACAEAWIKRDAMIDAGDKDSVKAMDLTCALLQERYSSIYQQWQAIGGTSNIDSITFPPGFVDVWCDLRTDAEKAADAFQEEYSNDQTVNDIRAGFQQW